MLECGFFACQEGRDAGDGREVGRAEEERVDEKRLGRWERYAQGRGEERVQDFEVCEDYGYRLLRWRV